ncbi:MAG: hypothetical protein ACK5LL_12615 [Suipraeoptans sp.]
MAILNTKATFQVDIQKIGKIVTSVKIVNGEISMTGEIEKFVRTFTDFKDIDKKEIMNIIHDY